MIPRDDFLLVMRVGKEEAWQTSVSGNPSSSAAHAPLAPQPAAAPAPPGAAAPLSCQRPFCEQQATSGDLCERHADELASLREEYYDLQREFEAGW